MHRICLTLLILALPAPLLGDDKPILVLNAGGHTNRVRGVFFTADGKELISVAEDKTIRVWSVADGESRRVLRLPLPTENRGADIGLAAALSPDGKTVAVGTSAPSGSGHWIYLVNLADEKVERVLKVGKTAVWTATFSPDGKLLATGGEKNVVVVWDLETGKMKYELAGHTEDIRCLAFSPDGKRLASGGLDKTVRLWSMETGASDGKLEAHADHVQGLAWSPDGKTLASSCSGQVSLWNPADGTLRKSIKAGFNGLSMAFSEDSTRLLVGSLLLDAATGAVKARYQGESTDEAPERGLCGALTRDSKTAAWSSVDGLLLWSTVGKGQKRGELFRLEGRGRLIQDLAWRADGKAIAWNRDMDGVGRTFSLVDLAFGELSDKTFIGARHSLGAVTLVKSKNKDNEIVAQREGKSPVPLAVEKELLNCWSLLGEGQAVLATATSMRRFDTTTGKQLQRFGTSGLRVVAPSPDNELFATGGIDQTVRVWTTKQDRPLLSLFVAGNEWIAWTPEGYYAASTGGERLIGWQINNGYEQLATFHPASHFHKSLYRPDVISQLLKERNVAKALAAANKESKRDDEIVEVEHVLPPKVRIVSPDKASITTDTETLEIKAVAESVGTYPVLSLQLLLDGRPYDGDNSVVSFDKPKTGQVAASWKVKLTLGKHTLAVLAKSKPSNATSSTVEVTYKQPKPPDDRPSMFVLAVGIDDYPNPSLKLTIAVNDAEELARTLQKQQGNELFAKVNVKVLKDKQATRDGMRKGLAWLKNKKSADLAVIFISAHGCVGQDGKLYLLAYDTDEDKLEKTGLGGMELKRAVSALPGRVLVLLCDCHAGAGPSTAKPSRGELARDLADDDCGAIVLCAALGSQLSLGSKQEKHSYFALALIEGLNGGSKEKPGEADYNKDGYISTTELFLYTQQRVSEKTSGRQTPTMTAPPVAPYAVSKL